MKNHHEIPKVYYLLVVAPSSAPTPSASSGIYERRRSRTTTSRAEGAEEETILDVFEALMLGISWGGDLSEIQRFYGYLVGINGHFRIQYMEVR